MFANIIRCSILLISVYSSLADEDSPTIVTLPNGKIQGHILKSSNRNNYYAFQEIPYAIPPVGDLRLKEALPSEGWEGILNATRNTKICYQRGRNATDNPELTQTEDCLYLNVYTPQIPSDSSEPALPVMFWIHGGGLVVLDGSFQSYGPQFFMDYNIVLVTINYRLGPLGFLTTEDEVIPGNLGLKDQNLAMQWVQKNIRFFGGDPERVTIAGESAGALSVGLHITSKRSAGLFRAAILQSGTGLWPYGWQTSARSLVFEVGRTINPNFTSQDSNELLKLLQSVPAEDIAQIGIALPFDNYDSSGWIVLEGDELEGAFITGPMHEDVKNGNMNRVPILIGQNSEELLTFLLDEPLLLNQIGAAMDNDTFALFIYNMTGENRYIAGNELRNIYTDRKFSEDPEAVRKFLDDGIFRIPAVRHAELQSVYADTYLYQFSYKGELGFHISMDIEGLDPNGVGHAEELQYMWATSTNSDINLFPIEDILTHIRLLRLWTNFVKYLNPTPQQDNLLERVIWPKVTPSNITYLNINSTLEVKPIQEEYQKWKEVIEKYAIPPLIGY